MVEQSFDTFPKIDEALALDAEERAVGIQQELEQGRLDTAAFKRQTSELQRRRLEILRAQAIEQERQAAHQAQLAAAGKGLSTRPPGPGTLSSQRTLPTEVVVAPIPAKKDFEKGTFAKIASSSTQRSLFPHSEERPLVAPKSPPTDPILAKAQEQKRTIDAFGEVELAGERSRIAGPQPDVIKGVGKRKGFETTFQAPGTEGSFTVRDKKEEDELNFESKGERGTDLDLRTGRPVPTLATRAGQFKRDKEDIIRDVRRTGIAAGPQSPASSIDSIKKLHSSDAFFEGDFKTRRAQQEDLYQRLVRPEIERYIATNGLQGEEADEFRKNARDELLLAFLKKASPGTPEFEASQPRIRALEQAIDGRTQGEIRQGQQQRMAKSHAGWLTELHNEKIQILLDAGLSSREATLVLDSLIEDKEKISYWEILKDTPVAFVRGLWMLASLPGQVLQIADASVTDAEGKGFLGEGFKEWLRGANQRANELIRDWTPEKLRKFQLLGFLGRSEKEGFYVNGYAFWTTMIQSLSLSGASSLGGRLISKQLLKTVGKGSVLTFVRKHAIRLGQGLGAAIIIPIAQSAETAEAMRNYLTAEGKLSKGQISARVASARLNSYLWNIPSSFIFALTGRGTVVKGAAEATIRKALIPKVFDLTKMLVKGTLIEMGAEGADETVQTAITEMIVAGAGGKPFTTAHGLQAFIVGAITSIPQAQLSTLLGLSLREVVALKQKGQNLLSRGRANTDQTDLTKTKLYENSESVAPDPELDAQLARLELANPGYLIGEDRRRLEAAGLLDTEAPQAERLPFNQEIFEAQEIQREQERERNAENLRLVGEARDREQNQLGFTTDALFAGEAQSAAQGEPEAIPVPPDQGVPPPPDLTSEAGLDDTAGALSAPIPDFVELVGDAERVANTPGVPQAAQDAELDRIARDLRDTPTLSDNQSMRDIEGNGVFQAMSKGERLEVRKQVFDQTIGNQITDKKVRDALRKAWLRKEVVPTKQAQDPKTEEVIELEKRPARKAERRKETDDRVGKERRKDEDTRKRLNRDLQTEPQKDRRAEEAERRKEDRRRTPETKEAKVTKVTVLPGQEPTPKPTPVPTPKPKGGEPGEGEGGGEPDGIPRQPVQIPGRLPAPPSEPKRKERVARGVASPFPAPPGAPSGEIVQSAAAITQAAEELPEGPVKDAVKQALPQVLQQAQADAAPAQKDQPLPTALPTTQPIPEDVPGERAGERAAGIPIQPGAFPHPPVASRPPQAPLPFMEGSKAVNADGSPELAFMVPSTDAEAQLDPQRLQGEAKQRVDVMGFVFGSEQEAREYFATANIRKMANGSNLTPANLKVQNPAEVGKEIVKPWVEGKTNRMGPDNDGLVIHTDKGMARRGFAPKLIVVIDGSQVQPISPEAKTDLQERAGGLRVEKVGQTKKGRDTYGVIDAETGRQIGAPTRSKKKAEKHAAEIVAEAGLQTPVAEQKETPKEAPKKEDKSPLQVKVEDFKKSPPTPTPVPKKVVDLKPVGLQERLDKLRIPKDAKEDAPPVVRKDGEGWSVYAAQTGEKLAGPGTKAQALARVRKISEAAGLQSKAETAPKAARPSERVSDAPLEQRAEQFKVLRPLQLVDVRSILERSMNQKPITAKMEEVLAKIGQVGPDAWNRMPKQNKIDLVTFPWREGAKNKSKKGSAKVKRGGLVLPKGIKTLVRMLSTLPEDTSLAVEAPTKVIGKREVVRQAARDSKAKDEKAVADTELTLDEQIIARVLEKVGLTAESFRDTQEPQVAKESMPGRAQSRTKRAEQRKGREEVKAEKRFKQATTAGPVRTITGETFAETFESSTQKKKVQEAIDAAMDRFLSKGTPNKLPEDAQLSIRDKEGKLKPGPARKKASGIISLQQAEEFNVQPSRRTFKDLGFFSKLEKELEEASLPHKTTFKDMLARVGKLVAKGKVRQEEVAWVGLESWLGEFEDASSVGAADVLGFVKANQVEVLEIELGDTDEGATRWGSFALPMEGYREVLLTMPNIKQSFQSVAHWGKTKNVFAHLRMSSAVDPSNPSGQTLIVQEMQSDWHQKGRAEGFKGDPPPFSKSWPELAWKRIIQMAAQDPSITRVAWLDAEAQLDPRKGGDPRVLKLYRHLYDSIAPQFLKKWTKKVTGKAHPIEPLTFAGVERTDPEKLITDDQAQELIEAFNQGEEFAFDDEQELAAVGEPELQQVLEEAAEETTDDPASRDWDNEGFENLLHEAEVDTPLLDLAPFRQRWDAVDAALQLTETNPEIGVLIRNTIAEELLSTMNQRLDAELQEIDRDPGVVETQKLAEREVRELPILDPNSTNSKENLKSYWVSPPMKNGQRLVFAHERQTILGDPDASRVVLVGMPPRQGDGVIPAEELKSAEDWAMGHAIMSARESMAKAPGIPKFTLPSIPITEELRAAINEGKGLSFSKRQAIKAPAYPTILAKLREQKDLLVGEKALLDVTNFVVHAGVSVAGKSGIRRDTDTILKAFIEVSMSMGDPEGTLNHEAFHIARDHFLSKSAQNVLSKAFGKGAPLTNQVAAILTEEGNKDAALDALNDPLEAMAYGFELYQEGAFNPKGSPKSIFKRLLDAFKRVGNWLRGAKLTSTQEVFDFIASGRAAKEAEGQGTLPLGESLAKFSKRKTPKAPKAKVPPLNLGQPAQTKAEAIEVERIVSEALAGARTVDEINMSAIKDDKVLASMISRLLGNKQMQAILKKTMGPKSDKEFQQEVWNLAKVPEELLTTMRKRKKGHRLPTAAHTAVAYMLLKSSTHEVARHAKRIVAGDATAGFEFKQSIEASSWLSTQMVDLTHAEGRNFRLMRHIKSTTDDVMETLALLDNLNIGMNSKTVLDQYAKGFLEAYEREGVAGGLDYQYKPAFGSGLLAFATENMISGLSTTGISLLENAANVARHTATTFFGGMFSVLKKYDDPSKIHLRETMALMVGATRGFLAAIPAIGHVLMTGETRPGVGSRFDDTSLLEAGQKAPLGPFWTQSLKQLVGYGYRIPGRTMILTVDEFFRVMNFEMRKNQMATADVLNKGASWGQWAKSLAKIHNGDDLVNFTEAGIAEADIFARQQTFQRQPEGRIANWVLKQKHAHPLIFLAGLGFFIRTLANVYEDGLRNTSLGRLPLIGLPSVHKIYKEGSKPNATPIQKRRLAEARTRLSFGNSLATMALGMAGAGIITGGGPPPGDPRREAWLKQNKPFSINLSELNFWLNGERLPKNEWMDLTRFGANSAPIVYMAMVNDVFRYNTWDRVTKEQKPDDEWWKRFTRFASGAIEGIHRTVLSKQYGGPLIEDATIFQRPTERALGDHVRSLVKAFTPGGRGVSQWGSERDKVVNQMNDLYDGLRAGLVVPEGVIDVVARFTLGSKAAGGQPTPKVGIFGEVVTRKGGAVLRRALPTPVIGLPRSVAIGRLERAGIAVNPPKRTYEDARTRRNIKWTRHEFAVYSQIHGRFRKELYERWIDSPRWKHSTPLKRREVHAALMTAVGTKAKGVTLGLKRRGLIRATVKEMVAEANAKE